MQGYGPKAPGYPSFVYPGSGATCDTKEMAAARAAAAAAAAPEGAAEEGAVKEEQGAAAGEAAMDVDGAAQHAQQEQQTAQGQGQGQANGTSGAAAEEGIEEDPDREFEYKGGCRLLLYYLAACQWSKPFRSRLPGLALPTRIC